jgi:hypothetical protein
LYLSEEKYRSALPSTNWEGRHSLPDIWLRAICRVYTSGRGIASPCRPVARTDAARSSVESLPMFARRSFTRGLSKISIRLPERVSRRWSRSLPLLMKRRPLS